ncbi:hypothetical protein FGG78_30820, partial [Thioclava sp. BHET1]
MATQARQAIRRLMFSLAKHPRAARVARADLRRWIPVARMALVGLAAGASAFLPDLPLTGLLGLPIALACARSRKERLGYALAFEIAMSLQLVPLLIGYGLPPVAALLCLSAVMIAQASLIALVPPQLAMLLTLFSPVFWGHPLWAAFEVTPVHGIAAEIFGLGLVLLFATRKLIAPACILYALCAVLRLAGPFPGIHTAPVAAIDTAFTSRAFLPGADWGLIAQKIEALPAEDRRPIALPESTLERDLPQGRGYFSGVAQRIGRSLLLGEATPKGPVMEALRPDGQSRVVYRQRLPILGVDWTPWTKTGAQTHPFSSGVAAIEAADDRKIRIGFLICYEAYLALPWLETIAAEPQAVVVVTNDRWSRGTLYPE